MTEPAPQSQEINSRSLLGRWWRWLTILLAVVLIIIILRSISLDAIIESLATIDTKFLMFALALNVGVYMMMAFRWRILYQTVERPPSFLNLFRVTLISTFFNSVLPSVIGGDTYRTLELGKHDDGKRDLENSFAIVFVDRIIGLVSLMIFGCVGILLNASSVSIEIVVITLVLLFALLFVLNVSMYLGTYELILRFLQWLPSKYLTRVEQVLNQIYKNISIYRQHRGLLIQSILVSLLLRFFWFVGGYFIGLSLSLDVELLTFVVFLPIIEIVRMVPLTIQGIGVREGLFILFFGSVGVSNSDAVLLATLIYLMATFIGIIGGGLYLADNLHRIRSNAAH